MGSLHQCVVAMIVSSLGVPFRMLGVTEAIPINLKIVFVSQVRFGYKRYVDFLASRRCLISSLRWLTPFAFQ